MPFAAEGDQVRSLTKDQESILFGVTKIEVDGITIAFSEATDVWVEQKSTVISIHSINSIPTTATVIGSKKNKLDTSDVDKTILLKPGAILECTKK